LKVLSTELSEDEAFRARFARESQLAAGLEHPNIVPVYEAGQEDELLFIAMRFVEGTDLRQLLSAEGALDPEHALRLLRPIAAALDIAHRRGLVHRDVKPANILISQDETGAQHPYLSDFGLSKHATSKSGLTKTGQFMGTIDYVAPEQVQGPTEVDGRTDQYSFACVLFQSLTGRVPFERDTDLARVFAHLQDDPPAATASKPELPAAIDDVLAHGMAKAKDDRYETCLDLVDAAAAALRADAKDRSATQAPPPTVVALPPRPPARDAEVPTAPGPQVDQQPPTPPRRRTALVIGGTLAAVAAVAVVIVLTQVIGQGPDGPTRATGGDTGDATGGTGNTGGATGGDPGVFADDFSDPQSGWGTRTSGTFSAEYVNGEYVVTVANNIAAYQELKGRGVSGDVRVEVDVTPTTSDFFFYGVTCHGVDPTPTTGRRTTSSSRRRGTMRSVGSTSRRTSRSRTS
jgi:Protein kinase domain